MPKIELEISDNLFNKISNMSEGMGLSLQEYVKVSIFLMSEKSEELHARRQKEAQRDAISQSIKNTAESIIK